MITKIKISGFKSFHEFEMEFSPLTIVAGANASGKSNLFDALQLLSRLAETDNLKKAFKGQRGELLELFTKYGEGDYATQMYFEVEMLLDKNIEDGWKSKAQLKYTRLRYALQIERFTNQVGMQDLRVKFEELSLLKQSTDKWFKKIIKSKDIQSEDWRPKAIGGRTKFIRTEEQKDEKPTAIIVSQDGGGGKGRRFPINGNRTILSTFDTVDFPHAFATREEMRSWKFLQPNPADLRQPTDKATGEDTITASGQNLAGALWRIQLGKSYSLKEISRSLNAFLPNFKQVEVIDDEANQQYLIQLTDTEDKKFSSRVLSEGTLRILALCVLLEDEKYKSLLCFEEPENGVHPKRIKNMVELLKDLSIDFAYPDEPLRQVIVNTHSPVVVGEIYNWATNVDVSIWYCRMWTSFRNIEGKRRRLQLTDISPVIKKKDAFQSSISISENVRRATLTYLIEMLETGNFGGFLVEEGSEKDLAGENKKSE